MAQPAYEVRWVDFEEKVGGPIYVHDGDGKIFIVSQVELPGSNNPKGCRIWSANADGSVTPLLTIPEIYGLPSVYLRQDGLAIVEGLNHELTKMAKVNIPNFTPRPDMMVSTWKRWRAYFQNLLGRIIP